ncbi:Uncharacterised protein [Proteus mirabilis]|uniref:Lipoprotein n=1 Tax=Proteus mirabilis TaxID=584 RepID=A0A379GF32_PROMI|nr:Uncharacterised protein [Proteus mirabilis]
MHDNKRTLLIILCLLLCGCIALVIWVLGSYKRDTLEIQNLICTAKSTIYIKPKHLIMKGTLVLDLQSNRIAIHYTVQHNQQEQQLFFQDIIISPLSRNRSAKLYFRPLSQCINLIQILQEKCLLGYAFYNQQPLTS